MAPREWANHRSQRDHPASTRGRRPVKPGAEGLEVAAQATGLHGTAIHSHMARALKVQSGCKRVPKDEPDDFKAMHVGDQTADWVLPLSVVSRTLVAPQASPMRRPPVEPWSVRSTARRPAIGLRLSCRRLACRRATTRTCDASAGHGAGGDGRDAERGVGKQVWPDAAAPAALRAGKEPLWRRCSPGTSRSRRPPPQSAPKSLE